MAVVGTGDFEVRVRFPDIRRDLENVADQFGVLREEARRALNIEREAREFVKDLNEIPRKIADIEKAVQAGFIPIREALPAIQRLRAEFREMGGEAVAARIDRPFASLAERAAFALQRVNELQRAISNLREASQRGQIAPGLASGEIQKANAQLRELGASTRRTSLEVRNNTQEVLANSQALGSLQSRYDLINKRQSESIQKTRALNALQSQARNLGGDLTRGLANFTEAGRNATGIAGLFTRATTRANEVLGRFGLTMRDLNVILGSGFLSTAGPALAVLLGITIVTAAVKAAAAMAQLAAESQRMRDRLEAGFGDSARIIEEFAEGSARSFGLTEKAAIQLTGTIGNLFQSFGTGQSLAATFAIDLAEAAKIIERTSFTTDSYEQVLDKLKGALTGNVEALREYGIAVNETTLRDTARSHSIQLVAGELDAAQKALLTYLFITDQANSRLDAFNETSSDVLSDQRQLSAAWEDLQATLGEQLIPAFVSLVDLGSDVLGFLNDLIEEVDRSLEPIARFTDQIAELLNLGTPEAAEAFERFAKGVGAAADEVSRNVSTIPFLPPEDSFRDFADQVDELFAEFEAGRISAEEFFETLAEGLEVSPEELQRQYKDYFDAIAEVIPELEKYRDELFDTAFAQKEAEESLRRLNEEKRKSPEFLNRLIDAYEDLNDVIEENAKRLREAREAVREARVEGAKAIQDALEDLDEARVEGVKDIISAQEDLREAEEDRLKAIAKAQKNLREAEEDRAEAISDAREALRDAQKEAAKQIADAEEQLADARIDAAKKVDEAERQLADARRQRAEEIFDANLSLFDALRQGDAEAENRARLELGRALRSRGVQDAQRNLNEARVEGAEAIAEAQEDLAEAQEKAAERVADAREKLVETIQDQNERVAEAAQRLAEVIEEQDERVAESAEKLAETREEVADRIIKAQEKLDEAEEKAAERLDEAREKLREVRDENEKRLTEAKQKVNELEGAWAGVNERVDELIIKLDILRRKHRDLVDDTGLNPLFGPGGEFDPRQRAHGGPVRGGDPYIIGERGPELFIPNRPGTVVSNDELIRVLHRIGNRPGGGSNFTVVEAIDAEATAAAIMARMAQDINN